MFFGKNPFVVHILVGELLEETRVAAVENMEELSPGLPLLLFVKNFFMVVLHTPVVYFVLLIFLQSTNVLYRCGTFVLVLARVSLLFLFLY
jgi:hypothetical protein